MIDNCGFGTFCSTPTNLMLFISLLKVLMCTIIILIERQIIRLSNDTSNINIGGIILLKRNWEFEKFDFFLIFFASDISLNN